MQIVQNDLTKEQVDAITNASNAELKHGGGVAQMILNAGGAAINNES